MRDAAATVRDEARSVLRLVQGARITACRPHFRHRLITSSLIVRGTVLAPEAVLPAGAVGTVDDGLLKMKEWSK